jgi:hypothetical protein
VAHSFVVAFNTAGVQSLTATDTANPSVTVTHAGI